MGIVSDVPDGMFRVIQQTLDTVGGSTLVGDFTLQEAGTLARDYNKKRCGPLDPAYWVYDSKAGLVLDHMGRDRII